MDGKVKRRLSREGVARRILVGCALFGGVLGAVIALVDLRHIAVSSSVLSLVAIGLLIGLSGVSLIYWRHLDEAAKEAHKFAWLWGSGAATVVVIPLTEFLSTQRLEALFGAQEIGTWVVLGMLGLLAAQAIGYGLVWAGWWLVRQR